MVVTTHSENETIALGRELARTLSPGAVVALYGELGAGKTAFVRGLADGLGVRARVSSPTFTIVNEYPGQLPLFHFDMYRVGTSDELFELGWDDYLERGGVVAVEWSENIADALPGDAVAVRIEKTGDDCRIVTILGAEGL
jgi:tRNA threonylcarbamoyladenosine biosynthesis protein TsaE